MTLPVADTGFSHSAVMVAAHIAAPVAAPIAVKIFNASKPHRISPGSTPTPYGARLLPEYPPAGPCEDSIGRYDFEEIER